MNFGKNGVKKKMRDLQSIRKKLQNKTLLTAVKVILVVIIFGGVVGTAALYGIVRGIIAESPDMSTIDVSPQGISSQVYNSDGDLIETLVTSGSNRDPVTYDQIPENLVNAFVAIEDARFWTHSGVDIRGLMRAGLLGIQSGLKRTQGASTITQQLIKNNVFNGGAESSLGAKIVRKIQEQYLAIELEKVMSKQDIMENYLNTINLGANCLGVQTAARRYFDKDVSELTLSECAVMAGITQNPVGYNPITHPQDNADKRETILEYMKNQGYITEEQQAEALADPVYERIQEINNKFEKEDNTPYSYFVDRLITEVIDDLQTKCGYSADQASALVYSGGLDIYTTQDKELQAIVDEEISDPSNYAGVANKYSFTYTLNVQQGGEVHYYTQNDIKEVLGTSNLNYNSEESIQEAVDAFKDEILKSGDKILSENIYPLLQPQASVVLMDQSTGEVKAISGGRGDKTVSLSLNRATNTRRSPGSTFKVLTAFAPAIDTCGNTLASVYYDEPYTEPSTGKTFRNWWGSNTYVGYANIRDAIVYSMNILAVKTLMDTVSPRLGYDYALDFGFNTLYERKETSGGIYTDIQPSLALGGLTDGVTNLQLTAAYATIANQGTYMEPIFYTRILDHEGNVLIDNEPETRQVLKESTAFLLTDAMSDSLGSDSLFGLFNPTSRAAALDNMPAAGKSGTATNSTDLWFVGYTPYYTMGIWTGFDDKTPMDANENSTYHKIIWKKIMDRINTEKKLKRKDFTKPDNIVQATICSKSGKLAVQGVCTSDGRSGMVYTEYFARGTEPTEECDVHYTYQVCKESGMRPAEYCTDIGYRVFIKLPEVTTGSTDDSSHAISGDTRSTCSLHQTPPTTEAETETEGETKPKKSKKKDETTQAPAPEPTDPAPAAEAPDPNGSSGWNFWEELDKWMRLTGLNRSIQSS